MKKQPVKHTTKPSYPTISEARSSIHDNKVLKGTAATLIIAAATLGATGCVDPSGVKHSGKDSSARDFINKVFNGNSEPAPDIVGDMIIETTECILDGEATTEYTISGDVAAPTELTEPTETESYDIMGDIAAPVDFTEPTEES